MSALPIIRGELTRADAEAAARRALSSGRATTERELLYPYYWFCLRARFWTPFGASGGRVSCLVDGRRGVASTTDVFEVDSAGAGAASVLDASFDEARAERLARRAARLAVGRRQRALAPAEWRLAERALLYKRFWVVGNGPVGAPRLLVDGVTGRIHPL